jgi:adenine deaminase
VLWSRATGRHATMFSLLSAGILSASRGPSYSGDIAICGDRVAGVGLLSGAEARDTIAATGLVVARRPRVHRHAGSFRGNYSA